MPDDPRYAVWFEKGGKYTVLDTQTRKPATDAAGKPLEDLTFEQAKAEVERRNGSKG